MPGEWFIKAPLTINWALNNNCNFRCRHCYSREDANEELEPDVLYGALEKAAKCGVMAVNFGGGEPLLRRDLPAVAQFASRCGLRVSMNSNGYLLDRDLARSLKQAGFFSVGVSIDSHLPEVHDAFRGVAGSHARATDALAHLQSVGVRTSISTVICRINQGHVDQLIRFARACGAQQLNFHNFKCSGLGYANRDELDLTPTEWKEFYLAAMDARRGVADLEVSFDDPIIASLGRNGGSSLVKGSVCGKLSLNIKVNGDITPCGFIPVVIGNIVRDDLRAVWLHSPVLEKLRNKQPTGKCSTCGNYAECLGGCSARALALTGDFNSPDPHCWT
ncbi:MAG: GeoRSP system radical SAM/SPASM protein [Deltaproteobacteria bacterium]|nr:GeoRSP system radical SAM/SPASM protein [Deltaproteobacteria bacterium]